MVPNFSFNKQFWFFKTIFPNKDTSKEKQKKSTSSLNSSYSSLSRYQIFLWRNNLKFYDQICPKQVYPVKSRKSEHHNWILHIWNNLSTKFKLKLPPSSILKIFKLKMIYQWNFPYRSKYPLSPLLASFCVWLVSHDMTITSFLGPILTNYVN